MHNINTHVDSGRAQIHTNAVTFPWVSSAAILWSRSLHKDTVNLIITFLYRDHNYSSGPNTTKKSEATFNFQMAFAFSYITKREESGAGYANLTHYPLPGTKKGHPGLGPGVSTRAGALGPWSCRAPHCFYLKKHQCFPLTLPCTWQS